MACAARTGREAQRYDAEGRRLVAGGIVASLRQGDGLRVLLVTSTQKGDWVFPKGGWETDETDSQAAVREIEEEAGVSSAPLAKIAEKVVVSSKGNASVWHVWLVREEKTFDDWAESDVRRRRWLSWADAKQTVRPALRCFFDEAERLKLLDRLHPHPAPAERACSAAT